MTDLHAQLAGWLADGALGDPPREIAVHASVCEQCTASLGAFDALALIDVGAAGSPPPLAARSRVRLGMAWARVGTAVTATVLAGLIVGFGIAQLVGSGGPASGQPGEPEGTELAGLFAPSDEAAESDAPSVNATQGEAPTPTTLPTPLPGVTPGPQPPPPAPGPTPPPPAPPPTPIATAVPTPEPPTPTPTTEPTSTPTPTPTPPGPPTSLTAQAGAGVIDLNWTAPVDDGGSPITGYNVYRSEDGGVTFSLLTPTPVGTTGYSDSPVSPGFQYFYYVTALNNIGESGPSNTEPATAS